jgi:hypothetical protein
VLIEPVNLRLDSYASILATQAVELGRQVAFNTIAAEESRHPTYRRAVGLIYKQEPEDVRWPRVDRTQPRFEKGQQIHRACLKRSIGFLKPKFQ